MSKATLTLVLGSMVLFTVFNTNLNRTINLGTDIMVDRYSEIQAKNIANSMVNIILSKLADDATYRVTLPETKNLLNGTVTYRVIDTVLVVPDTLIKIKTTAEFNKIPASVEVLAIPKTQGFIPPTLFAAVTTNNPIKTLGNLIIDGRDHSISGSIKSNSGTLAIWTTSTYQRKGNSKVGGTSSGTDFAPAKSFNPPSIVKTGQIYPGGYPNTPDSILGGTAKGFSPNTLKSTAQSGANGSQYTTNPSSLTYPLKGVTYVELPSGGTWNPANIEGEGILIVHNNSVNAIIKNLNSGTFKGILIADDIIHVHTDIIGAVIGLTPSPSSGNCLGNGNGRVLYSSEAILNATGSASNETISSVNGNTRTLIYSWYE